MNRKELLAKFGAEMEDERLKCSTDPVYFISKYIKVVHPVRGLVPFALYGFQSEIVKEYTQHRFNIIKKFRQAGITTICAAYALWYSLFKAEKTVLVVSIGDRESTSFLNRVWRMYDEMPDFLKIGTDERNKHVVTLSNKSRIKSVPSSDSAGRGESVSLLIVDEAAFIDNMEVFWAAIFPTISTGGEAIALSTVNGMSNWYYEFYDRATKGDNSFNVIDIFWQQHPEYTKEWAVDTRKNIGEKRWAQEYECEFLGTGDTFIDHEVLRRLKDNIDEDYDIKYNNRMRVWKYPEPFKEYVICADPALGVERDYSSFHVIDIFTGEQVAEFYSNKTNIREFAQIVAYEGELYNTAYCVVERNTIGVEAIRILLEELEYENLYSSMDKQDTIGVQVTNQNRDTILACLEEYLRENKINVKSERTVKELMTFIIDKNNKIQADEGYHDDLVMSLAIGCYAYQGILDSTPLEQRPGLSEGEKNKPLDAVYRVNSNIDLAEEQKWVYGR